MSFNVSLTPVQLCYLRECLYFNLECALDIDELETAVGVLRVLDEAEKLIKF